MFWKKGMTIFLILTLVCPVPVFAGLVDDWLAATTTAALPGHMEGQKRDYFMGGSFSARWPSTSDYLVSATLPRIRSGCGGIDMFLGSFSFLGFDYLVDKLQAMIMNAPAIAFDIAINAMMQQVSTSIGKFESIINALNSIQIDECAVAKNSAQWMANNTNNFGLGFATEESAGTDIAENKQKSGAWNSWYQGARSFLSDSNYIKPADMVATTAGCSNDFKEIFLASNVGGYLLENISSKMAIPPAYVSLIRGYIGDVIVAPPDQAYKLTYVPPCEKNLSISHEDLASGRIWVMSAATAHLPETAGRCSLDPSVNNDLNAYVVAMLNKVVSAMKNKTTTDFAVGSDEYKFIDSTPFPLYAALKTAVATNQEGPYVTQLSELVAQSLAIQMMADIFQRIHHMTNKGKVYIGITNKAVAGSDAEGCLTQTLSTDLMASLTNMADRAVTLQQQLSLNYTAASSKGQQYLDIMNLIANTNDRLNAHLTKNFGPVVAKRSMGQ